MMRPVPRDILVRVQGDVAVSTIAGIGERPRRRLPIGRIVLLVIVLAIFVEPIVMYRSLLRQREARDAREQSGLMLMTPSGSYTADGGR
jgi:hypothetical protein